MKKALALISALCLLLSLCACGSSSVSPDTFNQAPEEDPDYKGSVYYLCNDPEHEEQWLAAAESYEQQTGVSVKVVCAGEEQYYQLLSSEMNKLQSPTLFHCAENRLSDLGSYCLDLSETPVLAELQSPDYVLKDKFGSVLSMGFHTRSYGILVNKTLLLNSEHSAGSIRDFESLKAVVEDIHSRAEYLGYDAFAPAPLGSSLKLFSQKFANLPLYYELRRSGASVAPESLSGEYVPYLKNIWDLVTNNSSVPASELFNIDYEASKKEFLEGRAVFYLSDSSIYSELLAAGANLEAIDMLPLYCGVPGEEKAGLCTGPDDFWSVNNEAPEKDIQATLDFMYWLASSQEGLALMNDIYGSCTFRSSHSGDNVFEYQALSYISEGFYPVLPANAQAPSGDAWVSGISEALARYTAGSGNFDLVISAFTQLWAAPDEGSEAETK